MDHQRDLFLMCLDDDELRHELARYRRLRVLAIETGGEEARPIWNAHVAAIEAEIALRIGESGLI